MKSLSVMSKGGTLTMNMLWVKFIFVLFTFQFYLIRMKNIKHNIESHICYKWQSLTIDVCDVNCN
jgi:hypothetical protein